MMRPGTYYVGEDGWVAPETANQARQYINIAKYIMFNLIESKEVA